MQQTIYPVPGISLGTTAAGIKHAARDDLLVMELVEGASCAAVFTKNAFCAAPVQVAREHLSLGPPRYLLINSGNANAGMGKQGVDDALACCRIVASQEGCDTRRVAPFSTGVIGQRLPMEAMQNGIPQALASLREDAWPAAAQAIMTTDTRAKLASRKFTVDGESATITGIAKGAGMICPDMATMLAFIATDLPVDGGLLHDCLEQAVTDSFNAISVDGDTSTNDACVLVATGENRSPLIEHKDSLAFSQLTQAVTDVCMELAREIVRDGEGATKLVSIQVEQAASSSEAKMVAYTIAHSPLVKTALFAADPNWGRILAAVGRAGVDQLDIERVEIWLDEVCIVKHGGVSAGYTEESGQQVMDRDEFVIRVVLGRGSINRAVLTCDLSYDYVKINAEYRT